MKKLDSRSRVTKKMVPAAKSKDTTADLRQQLEDQTEAVSVYELLSLKGQLGEAKRRTVERYAQALALYREARFAEAVAALEAALAEDPGDGPSQALAGRCRTYMQKPPPLPFEAVASLEK
jgi:adenylate cyclase